MASHGVVVLAATAIAARLALASGPFKFCTDDVCKTCPVQVSDAGTGYPNCVVYKTTDVFGGNDDFDGLGSESGGYSVFLDVEEPDKDCQTIIKSPAGTSSLGCGYPIASYRHEACGHLELDTTFMVQKCCGDDCENAGLGTRSAKFPLDYLQARGGGGGGGGSGLYLHGRDGKRIEPIEVGVPPEHQNAGPPPQVDSREVTPDHGDAMTVRTFQPSKRDISQDTLDSCKNTPAHVTTTKRSAALFDRDTCNDYKGTWKQLDKYTRPADNSSVMLTDVAGGTGGVSAGVTATRSQTWTTSVGMDFGFADVFSMGINFSEDESCQLSDSQTYTFNVPAGQSGNVYWTATMQCYTGTYSCSGKESEEVEVCTPILENNTPKGTFAVVAGN